MRQDLADDVGPHCGVERLIAYRQGALPAAEREAVQEHLSLCPRCTGLWRELRDFEAAAVRGDAGPPSLRQEAWDALARRLPRKTPAVRPIAGAAPREAPRRRRLPRFAAAAAAALLLALVGLSLWAAVTAIEERRRLARLEQRLEERDAALARLQSSLAATAHQLDAARGRIRDLEQERSERPPQRDDTAVADRGRPDRRADELTARVAELTSEVAELRRAARPPEPQDQLAASSLERAVEVSVAPRYALRGQQTPRGSLLRPGGVVNSVRSSQENRFTVALSLADHAVRDEYRFELADRDGKVLWSGRRPGRDLLGDDGTSVSVAGLAPGRYRLRIAGLRQDRGELLAEYILQVEP